MNAKRSISFAVAILLFLAAAVSVRAADIDWGKARDIRPGIKLYTGIKKTPRLIRYFIMRIDLKTPGLSLYTTGRDKDWGKPMPDRPGMKIATKRITSADFMKNARKS